MVVGGNNPPYAILELTKEQAQFLIENCDANSRLCMAAILSLQTEKLSLREKREAAEKWVATQEKFNEIRTLLFKAGATRKEDNECET